jgi:hypothetical protein
MRTRATIAALSGALAIAALSAPAAHAAGTQGDATIKSVSVNGGKAIVLGTTNSVSVPVSVTVTDPETVYADTVLIAAYHGSYDDPDALYFTDSFKCAKGATNTYTCTGKLDADPAELWQNSSAGTWNVSVLVDGTENDKAATVKVQRYDRISASNASPEPITKGKSLTITSTLTRASWEDGKYHGYAQTAELQFKKKGTSTYKDVKAVTASSSGALKTTYKASYDGYWRYSFKGSSTSPAISATSDYVDVK